ncbi:nucleotidyltransferase domain-containing protein [Saccharibacillus sp. CPCC 101409]|uniref:nucleotidyltransferase domain-containing protein n=1 Tax=Saccharibacillus sp. CPCC 101409 TaxID=3058041 RepID=UPI0026725276|nr:nucleotidyltransferase domain-containing protein [Saccharibacillus sp. CPCC 101409]MDO3408199.1 nucleotidyltransferase domain-containing protein [Saccharibacillus sp. CPCC 101409]
MTANPVRQKIEEELSRIEREENVRILYACESGSRAWGFPSRDSDYDVRFLYVHEPEWYMSVFDRRDVIERPISDLLDINGWDLRKALRLFRKSNPPLLEWLQSPIVYREIPEAANPIRSLAGPAFSPKACTFHYLHMASGNYRDYLRGEAVRSKKYFYVLRPLLACRWIERFGEMPPMAFDTLKDTLLEPGELKTAVEQLLERKKSGIELKEEPRIEVINQYLETQIAYFEQKAPRMPDSGESVDDRLDPLFRCLLRTAWKEQETWQSSN